MKTQNTKLTLNKSVITELNDKVLSQVNGGSTDIIRDIIEYTTYSTIYMI